MHEIQVRFWQLSDQIHRCTISWTGMYLWLLPTPNESQNSSNWRKYYAAMVRTSRSVSQVLIIMELMPWIFICLAWRGPFVSASSWSDGKIISSEGITWLDKTWFPLVMFRLAPSGQSISINSTAISLLSSVLCSSTLSNYWKFVGTLVVNFTLFLSPWTLVSLRSALRLLRK